MLVKVIPNQARCVHGQLKNDYNTTSNGLNIYHYTCDCKPGVYGDRCQFHDVCQSPQLCLNNGTCQNRYVSNAILGEEKAYYYCQCAEGFYGNQCQYGEDMDEIT